MVAERLDLFELDFGAVRQHLAPVVPPRVVDRRFEQPEVDRVLVGVDQEPVAPVIDGVFDALLARRDQAKLARRVVGLQVVRLARVVVSEMQHQKTAGARAIDADEERFVGLLEDDRVRFAAAQDVSVQTVRPVRVVQRRVEQRTAVGGPLDPGVGALDDVRQVFAADQIAHADRVGLASVGVRGPGQQAMVGADGDGSQAVVLVPVGFEVGVEKDFLCTRTRAGQRAAAEDPVLLPLLRPAVVREFAPAGRSRFVIFLDSRDHLLEQRLDVGLDRRRHRVGIGVLRAQVREHFFVFSRVVSQPVVGIGKLDAVVRHAVRDAFCDGRLGR